jgi:hypothetical protein
MQKQYRKTRLKYKQLVLCLYWGSNRNLNLSCDDPPDFDPDNVSNGLNSDEEISPTVQVSQPGADVCSSSPSPVPGPASQDLHQVRMNDELLLAGSHEHIEGIIHAFERERNGFHLVRQNANAPMLSPNSYIPISDTEDEVLSQFQMVRRKASTRRLSPNSYITISDTEDDESSRHELDPSGDSLQLKRPCSGK